MKMDGNAVTTRRKQRACARRRATTAKERPPWTGMPPGCSGRIGTDTQDRPIARAIVGTRMWLERRRLARPTGHPRSTHAARRGMLRATRRPLHDAVPAVRMQAQTVEPGIPTGEVATRPRASATPSARHRRMRRPRTHFSKLNSSALVVDTRSARAWRTRDIHLSATRFTAPHPRARVSICTHGGLTATTRPSTR